MKKKIFKNLKSGVFATLPVLIFVWLIKWLIKLFFGAVDRVLEVVPYRIQCNPIILEIIGSVVIILLIFMVGFLVNHYYIGKKIRLLLNPIINRTPILKTLFKITKQVKEGLDKKSSFEEVILVRFPTKDVLSLGFITSEDLEVFNESTGMELVAVFVPTTPNPTNGFLMMIEKESVIKTSCPVPLAISFVMSMGTVGATKKIVESYSKV